MYPTIHAPIPAPKPVNPKENAMYAARRSTIASFNQADPVLRLVGTSRGYQEALGAALAYGGARSAEPAGARHYTVFGDEDETYTVRVGPDGAYHCTCPLGRAGQPCWHAAAAWLRHSEEGEYTAPAARPPARRRSTRLHMVRHAA
jgi:hypothetical protein